MLRKTAYSSSLIFFAGVIFSVLAAYSIHNFEKQAIQYEIQKDVDNVAYSLTRELNIGIELLYSLRSQLGSLKSINSQNFSELAKRAIDRQPEILSIKWIDVVADSEREEYEKILSDESGIENIFELSETGNKQSAIYRKSYYPVRFLYPNASSHAMQGLDLASNSVFNSTINTSRYRNIPIATPGIWLKREFGEKNGFSVLLPIFQNLISTPDNREPLRGFLLALFDVQALFKLTISKSAHQFINFSLIDTGVGNKEQTIYERNENTGFKTYPDLDYMSEPIYFAGREWVLEGTPLMRYVDKRLSFYPHVVFGTGVVIFTLLSYLIYLLQHRAYIIQKLVESKTRELRETNKKLSNLSKCDGLTGLFNRDFFNSSLENEISRAQRERLTLTVMLIEIDGLIEYNDVNGREAANNFIKSISQILDDELKRPSDLLARYDNDKFAVLLPNTRQGNALAQRFIEKVALLKLSVENLTETYKNVSVSIGGVTVNELDQMKYTQIISLAENALSRALSEGRGKFFWSYFPENSQPVQF